MTLADVKKFYGSVLAGDCALFASGGVPAAEVRALIAKRFASLPAGATGPATVPPPPASGPRIILVDKPGAPQSVLRYGEAVAEVTPLSERVADSLFNTILGGGFTSRLNQNLREKHGYTYGAGSRFAWSRHGGPFSADSAVKADVTGPAIHEMEAEVSGILAQGLTSEELDKAKALSVEGLVEALESSGGTAQAFARLWMLGRSLDEISQQIPALRAIALDDVKAAAAKSLKAQALTLVIVGDAATVLPQLQKEGLGAPEIWAVEGHQAKRVAAAIPAKPAISGP
jgi:predicted Zn-dependent peptidase